MRRLRLVTLLALANCQPPQAQEAANRTMANVAAPAAASGEENKAFEAQPAAPHPAELANFSPSQRRAYERGFADCGAGRYDPERGPEAYRLGCAAANDR
jgi:hypothetical protein